jgi:hypothetical protein
MSELKAKYAPIILLGDEKYKAPVKRKPAKKKPKVVEPIPDNKSVYDYI